MKTLKVKSKIVKIKKFSTSFRYFYFSSSGEVSLGKKL